MSDKLLKKSSYQIIRRANLIFFIVITVLIVSLLTTIFIGTKTDELEKKVIKPLSIKIDKFMIDLAKLLEEEKKTTHSTTIETNTIININNSTSSSNINLKIKITPGINNNRIKIYPTFILPTRPLSTSNSDFEKWQKEFDEKWEQMTSENKASYEEFCKNNPQASICK